MTGSGTELDPYIITTVDDLQAMENDLAAYYELGGDIDASATTTWNTNTGFMPIGQASYFTGQLDGKDYTISDLFINRNSYYQALLGQIESATIQNVTISVNITGNHYAAALVGKVEVASTISDCHSSGTVDGSSRDGCGGLIGNDDGSSTISNCSSSCAVSGRNLIGGLIGDAGGSDIDNCYATGNVDGDDYIGGFIGYADGDVTIDQCYATGNVTAADDYSGGFIGYMTVSVASTIDDCYATGDVSGDNYVGGFAGATESGVTIDDCYSVGAVTGNTNTGGFGGFCDGSVTNCFWDTTTSGQATSSGGTGKTTAEMKTKTTFTDAGWDFTTPVWYIGASTNNGYPAFTVGYPYVQAHIIG